jgi:transketolase
MSFNIYTNQQLRELANAIRFLSIDSIENANSGHPGMPMGFADIATILFSEFLKFNPQDPKWPNRDRFILSAGHGSMLLYSLLYLTGYNDIALDDFKNFRKLHSKLAGHPEYGLLDGIETTTGPLGQGLANAVGIAIAERLLNSRLGDPVINHKTYAVVGDGCLMEGVSGEAASLAGHLKLNNLIVLFDSNKISIDGPTDLATSDNTSLRFESYNWEVIKSNGHDFHEIRSALYKATKSHKPCLIIFDTKIGFGSPNKESSEKSHGSPLGTEEVNLTRKKLNWQYGKFEIEDSILATWRKIGQRSTPDYNNWMQIASNKYEQYHQNNFYDIENIFNEIKTDLVTNRLEKATRKSSGNIIELLSTKISNLVGGSADLSESNNTKTRKQIKITKDDFSGNYIHYGIREHAMGAIMNGIALHSTFIPFGGTFLVFSDYMRPAIRLSALMKIQVIYLMTHDSIGLGEDGPTHQPIEHLASLRLIPNLFILRPADDIETAECWEIALKQTKSPTLLALSRQSLPQIREDQPVNMCNFGAYIIKPAKENKPLIVIYASGSELHIAMQAASMLEAKNLPTQVVSVPCFELFEKQDTTYKVTITPPTAVKVAVEAGTAGMWHRFIGDDGIFIGIGSFGASAPAEKLYEYFGITAKNIFKKVMERVNDK